MGIELYWDNDERDTFLVEFEGKWTWDELFEMLAKVKRVTDRSPHTIGALLDVSRGSVIPGGSFLNATALEHARSILKMGEGGSGPVVVVGANPLVRMLFSTFLTLDRDKLNGVRFAATQDEGRLIIDRALGKPRVASDSTVHPGQA